MAVKLLFLYATLFLFALIPTLLFGVWLRRQSWDLMNHRGFDLATFDLRQLPPIETPERCDGFLLLCTTQRFRIRNR